MGVFFTWLTGKQARDHEQARVRSDQAHRDIQQIREEKRETYLSFLAAAARMEEALFEHAVAQSRSDERKSRARTEVIQRMQDLREKAGSLRLIAPDEVKQEAKDLTESVARKVKQIREGGANIRDARLSTGKTLKAMGVDLGYRGDPTDPEKPAADEGESV